MTLAGLSPAGALIVRAGEPFALQVGFPDDEGDLQNLSGREFALAIRYTDQTVPFLTIAAELDGQATTVVALGTADQANRIYAAGLARRVSYDFMELTGGATSSRFTERVAVQPGTEIPGEVVPQYMDLPMLAVTVTPQRLLVSERGRPGFGAEQRLYQAGLIAEPTVPAMDEYLRLQGYEAALPVLYATEDARDVAIAAKDGSENSRVSSEDARAGAIIARDQSQAAAQTAILGGPIYANKAAGEAVTANGQQFTSYGPARYYATRYLMVGGVGVAQDMYPNAAALELVGQSVPLIGDGGGLIVDGSGVFQSIMPADGIKMSLVGSLMLRTDVSGIDARNMRVDMIGDVAVLSGKIPLHGDGGNLVVDLNGNAVAVHRESDGAHFVADALSMVRPGAGGSGGVQITYGPPTGDWQYTTGWFVESDDKLLTVFFKVGQSWDLAQSKDAGDATITGTAQHPGWALMFDAGTRPNGAAVLDIVDLKEAATASSYETPLSGMADSIMSMTQAAVGRKPRCLFAVAAQGGTAYYGSQTDAAGGMKRGSTSYLEWTRLLERARLIAAAKGWRIHRVIFDSNHGHEDTKIGTTAGQYRKYMEQFVFDARKDVASILGPGIDVRFFCGQVNRMYQSYRMPSDVALAQLDPPSGWFCHGPAYDGPVSDDHAHLKARGWRLLGRRNGYYIAHAVWRAPIEPLRIDRIYWTSASTFRIQYNRALTLEETDALVTVSTLGVGKGIAFWDGLESDSPTASVTISSVAVITVPSRIPNADGTAASRADTVEVVLSGPPTGRDPRVVIAGWSPINGSGATEGPRSGLRSSAALLTDALTSTTIYDWASHEVRPIPYRR